MRGRRARRARQLEGVATRGRLAGQGPGVCPDAGLASRPQDNNVELISCTRDNGVLTVEFRRPLAAHDECAFPPPLFVSMTTLGTRCTSRVGSSVFKMIV